MILLHHKWVLFTVSWCHLGLFMHTTRRRDRAYSNIITERYFPNAHPRSTMCSALFSSALFSAGGFVGMIFATPADAMNFETTGVHQTYVASAFRMKRWYRSRKTTRPRRLRVCSSHDPRPDPLYTHRPLSLPAKSTHCDLLQYSSETPVILVWFCLWRLTKRQARIKHIVSTNAQVHRRRAVRLFV